MKTIAALLFLMTRSVFAIMSAGDRPPAFTNHAIMFWNDASEWYSRAITIRSHAGWIPLACFRLKKKDNHVQCFFQTDHGAEQQEEEIIGEAKT